MKEVSVVKVFNAVAVAADDSEESKDIDLNTFKPEGDFSLQIDVSGDGTASVEYLVSNDGINFFAPVGSSAIFSSFTKSSGTAGKAIDAFVPEVGRYMKIKVTETAKSSGIVISAWLAMR